MRYKSFTFKNFKGIKETTIDLSYGGVMCLVGLNEQGKTTILEGIHLCYQHLAETMKDASNEDVAFELTNGDLSDIAPREDGFTGDVVLSCIIEDSTNKHYISFSYSFKNNASVGRLKTEVKDFEGDLQELIKNLKQGVPDVLFHKDFEFDLPKKIYFAKFGTQQKDKNTLLKSEDYNEDRNKFCCEVLNDVFKSCYPNLEGGIVRNIVDWTRYSNKPADKSQGDIDMRVETMQKTLQKNIVGKWKEILNIEGDGDTNGEYEIRLTRAHENSFVSVKLSIWKNGRKLDILEGSLGMRWVLSFLLLTEFRSHRTKNALFLLDKPATNMHCIAQGRILDSLVKLGTKTNVIYNTHSPYLIKEELLFNTYIVKNYSDNDMRATRYFEHRDTDKHVRLIDDLLKLHYPQTCKYIFSQEPCVLVRGNGDVFYFELMYAVLEYLPTFVLWRCFDAPNMIKNIAFCDRNKAKCLVLNEGDISAKNHSNSVKDTFRGYHCNDVKTITEFVEHKTDIESLFTEGDMKLIISLGGLDASEASTAQKLKEALCKACPVVLLKYKQDKSLLSIGNETKTNFRTLFSAIENHFGISCF